MYIGYHPYSLLLQGKCKRRKAQNLEGASAMIRSKAWTVRYSKYCISISNIEKIQIMYRHFPYLFFQILEVELTFNVEFKMERTRGASCFREDLIFRCRYVL